MMPGMMSFEEKCVKEGYRIIAGVDEAGRGSFAGPLTAAAVILYLNKKLPVKIDDSKKLRDKERRSAFSYILSEARACSVGVVDQETVDREGVGNAVKKAMWQAVNSLSITPDMLLVDAVTIEGTKIPQKALIKGDALSVSIAAASIVAKVFRDKLMAYYHRFYPVYDWQSNKGYGTEKHRWAIKKYGPCFLHRFSFRGVSID